jgi:hypothetical protein
MTEILIKPQQKVMTLKTAALVAGFSTLLMAITVPVIEFYIFPKLIDYKDPAITTTNIIANRVLFTSVIFIHFLTVICDLVLVWALYIFLSPANRSLAIVTSLFRLVYIAFNVVAISNLVQILSILNTREYFRSISPGQVGDSVLLLVNAFNLEWRLGLVFFGIYLTLLGFLVCISGYIPKFLGAFLILAGAGYLAEDLKFFFYPGFDTGFLWFTFFGELIFMIWLLVKGWKVNVKLSRSQSAL